MQSHLDLRDLLPGCWPLAVRLPILTTSSTRSERSRPPGSGPSCPGLSGDREGVAVGDRGTV